MVEGPWIKVRMASIENAKFHPNMDRVSLADWKRWAGREIRVKKIDFIPALCGNRGWDCKEFWDVHPDDMSFPECPGTEVVCEHMIEAD